MGRDSATFRDKGTKVPSLSRDKGTTEQAKNHANGRDGTQDKTGQSRKGCSKTGKRCSKTEKDVQKQEKMFKNRKMMF